jgi:hypothetical protein
LVRSSLVTANSVSKRRKFRKLTSGHLVHDHVRLRGPDRRDHRLTVQAVDDGGRVLPVTSWPAAIRLGTR